VAPCGASGDEAVITCTVAFLVALGLASALTPMIRQVAVRRGWLDQVRSTRKLHVRPIPRLGGIAIVIAFFVPLVGLLIIETNVGDKFLENSHAVTGIFVGGLLIAALGVWDDVRGIGARQKFFVQFIVAAIMFGVDIRIEHVTTPWGGVHLGAFALPVTLLWIVGVINAMNLIDGLDGLASGVALVAVATNFVLATVNGNILMMLFMAALAGAILGFLAYNFNPASIFMGDTGSMFLGFVLATSSIVTASKSTATVSMLVPVLALGLPLMDTLLALARRALRGQPLFSADKQHVHHRLLELGLSHRMTVIVLYGVCLLFAGVALFVLFANGRQIAFTLAVFAVVLLLFLSKLGYFTATPASSTERVRNLALHEQVRMIGEALNSVAAPTQAWQAVQSLVPSIGVSEFALSLKGVSESGARETCRFHWSVDLTAGARVELRLPIDHGGANLGELQVAWHDGREISRDDEIALELLRDHLAVTARRFTGSSQLSSGTWQ
jgi:UDP-GlcNAc:undecaprenyl-phosphate GlcNAc-1-phosphate transferase